MLKPRKELGQNFLSDKQIARNMVESLGIESGEDLIEIGPGPGILTEIISKKIENIDSKLTAVEIDKRMCKVLEENYSQNKKIEIICENVLDYLPNLNPERKFKIIGSLPYYITSPILHKIISMELMPETCVFLVQKEVAEKIKNKAPDSSYLSSFVQTFFDVTYLGKVEAKKFYPIPQVDGGIIKLVKKQDTKNIYDIYDSEFKKRYEGFLHKAFSHPRKMLNKAFTADELEKGNINSSLRPQNLDASEWLEFFGIINKLKDNEK